MDKWHYRPDTSSNPNGHPSGDYMIGDCDNLPDNIAVCTTIQHARLIAAAPDLLAVAQMVVGDFHDDTVYQAAVAAIAKATQPGAAKSITAAPAPSAGRES